MQGAVRLEALAPVEVKGKTEPVPIYKVIGTLPRRSPIASRSERTLSPFVGGNVNSPPSKRYLPRWRQGKDRSWGLWRKRGEGSRDSCTNFGNAYRTSGSPISKDAVSPTAARIPYHPLIDVLRHNCGISETDSPEAIIEKVHFALQEVGMDAEESAPYLLQLLGVKEGTESLPH